MNNTNRKLNTRSLGRCGKKSYSGTFQKDKKCRGLRFFWIFIISLFLLLILFIYLLSSNWLNIKRIEIKGLDEYKALQIEDTVYKQQESKNILFSQKSLVFFSKNKLFKNLEEFNFLELSIDKKYFGKKLIIDIKEREKALIFKENNYFLFIDKEGNIISSQIDCQNQLASDNPEEIRDNENCLDFNDEYKKENLFPFIENNGQDRILESQKKVKLEAEYIDFSLKIYNDLRGGDDFDLDKIILDEDYNTTKIKLNNGLEVYFNFRDDYSEQISRFFTLKREKRNDLQDKKYIDLRYGDKIFYY
jgi:cell division septal protein FtsQ